jgi:GNAT superfamily N-acetyltransferase
MLQVRTLTHEDIEFALRLTDTMNWGLTASDFEFMIELEPDGCFILTEGSEKIGFAENVNYGPVAWFGNLIVKQNQRNKGAGSRLVEHSIEYLKRKHAKTIGLYAYADRIHFYERLGFKLDQEFSVLTGKTNKSPIKSKPKKTSQQHLEQIIEFDHTCFGASRRKLLEPIIADADNLCEAINEMGHVTGYLIAKIFGKRCEIGPLICMRKNETTAINLLNSVLEKIQADEISTCLASDESQVLNFLKNQGFTESFKVARMYLGSPLRQDRIIMAESLERG